MNSYSADNAEGRSYSDSQFIDDETEVNVKKFAEDGHAESEEIRVLSLAFQNL